MALDIEIIEPPTQDGLDIVPLATMKRHLRIPASTTAHDEDIEDCIRDAAAKLHGFDGELNRMLFPCVLRRYFRGFPSSTYYPHSWRRLRLPYPPLIELLSVDYVDAEESSPSLALDPADYVIRTIDMIPEVCLINSVTAWPVTLAHPRSASITYRAGYTEYPRILMRMVKILSGHYWENREASIQEPRQMSINRKIEYGMNDLRAALKIQNSYDDWIY